jgi:hypothetical protein
MKKLYTISLTALAILFGGAANSQILYDNGPIANSFGTGAGGADESVLYTTTFGMGTIGFGHQAVSFNRVADDFVNTNCLWQIDSIVFFGYQTGSTTTSTFTGVNFRIWDSIPDAPGSSIVFGDTTTNRMTRTAWSGVYRITETTTGNSQRPIMRNVCATPGLTLQAGTFWLDWSSSGSLGSGPWAQPRVPLNTAITGNGRQRIGSTWNNLVDGGTNTPAQGLPFIIYGTIVQPAAAAGTDNTICNGNSITIGGTPSGSGGTGVLTYSWSPSGTLNSSTASNPVSSAATTTSYVLTVTDALGCTAIDTVVVNVLQTSTSSLSPVVCGSYSSPAGNTFTTSGTYTDTLVNSAGCDSLITINLTVNNATTANVTVSACDQYTSPSGNVYTNSGVYVDTIPNSLGCDSVITTNLTIDTLDLSISMSGVTLTSNQSGATYQWVYCDSAFAAIPGENAQSYFPLIDGNYAVIVTANSCSDTSACITVIGTGITSGNGSMIGLYPNPSDNIINLVFAMNHANVTVVLRDLNGRAVYTSTVQDVNRMELNPEVAAGMYILEVNADGVMINRPVIRQ